MGKVLVIQGAGMNMRGKAQIETFGSMTLEEINEQIKGYAEGLGLDIELMHSKECLIGLRPIRPMFIKGSKKIYR